MLRFALLEQPQQVLQRHSRIQDVFDNDDCFPLDAGVQVPRQTHLPRRARSLPVARHRDEVKRTLPGNTPCKIGEEKHATLQYANQMQLLAAKITPDLLCQFLDTLLNPRSRNQNSDALARLPRTFLPRFLWFRHQVPRTQTRDSNARRCSGQDTLVLNIFRHLNCTRHDDRPVPQGNSARLYSPPEGSLAGSRQE